MNNMELASALLALTWPDLLLLAVVGLWAWTATRRGFIAVLFNVVALVLALAVAFNFYPVLAGWFTEQAGWSPVWSKPLAFVALWAMVQGLASLIENLLLWRIRPDWHFSQANRLLAVLPGALQGLLTGAILLTMLALLPVGRGVRDDILNAPLSGRLVAATLSVERPLEGIFGPAAHEALGLLIVPPARPGEATEGAVRLNFTVQDALPDPTSEQAMLDLVNQERMSRGLLPLEMDGELRLLARAHADDMFKRGYFSHDTPEGIDPFERMRQANISYGVAGENLALAPTLEMAHRGLMDSPGHRANILRPEFRKVGIGVLDGGIYGKMFVQEFTDRVR